jgi:hypothetical protein
MGDPTQTPIETLHPDERENLAAALAICARARDGKDARHLLDVCGLLRHGAIPPRRPRKEAA